MLVIVAAAGEGLLVAACSESAERRSDGHRSAALLHGARQRDTGR